MQCRAGGGRERSSAAQRDTFGAGQSSGAAASKGARRPLSAALSPLSLFLPAGGGRRAAGRDRGGAAAAGAERGSAMSTQARGQSGRRAADPDGEMPATEKDLAEDAPWKRIQQNTFTRWCNEHLRCVNKRIGNLQHDLSDGLRLIALLEVLSQKRMYRKYHQRPTFRQMQLENVSVALEFLERESIKLVSIGECLPTRSARCFSFNLFSLRRTFAPRAVHTGAVRSCCRAVRCCPAARAAASPSCCIPNCTVTYETSPCFL